MRKNILTLLMMAIGLSISANAGGKNVIRAVAPVAPVIDASHWYLGAGLTWAKLSAEACHTGSGCTYEDATYGGMVRAGYDYNKYIGVEARYIRTFLGQGPFGGAPLEHAGLYLKPQYQLTENIDIYALLGYGYTKNLGNGARLNYFKSSWGFSAGAGVEYRISGQHSNKAYSGKEKGMSVFVDYQRLLIRSNHTPTLDAVSSGVKYSF